jgi:hypothetical protein
MSLRVISINSFKWYSEIEGAISFGACCTAD